MELFFGWLGVVLSAIGIAVGARVAFVIHRRETTKRLGYRVVAHTPLVSQGAGSLELLTIRYGDRRLDDARLVVLQISNPGSAAVQPGDFQNDLRVSLEGGAHVVSVVGATIGPGQGANPPSVTLSEGGELKVSPLLLNPGDFVELQVLLDGVFTGVRVVGHLADVRSIEELSGREAPDRARISLSPYGILLGVLLLAILVTVIWLTTSLFPDEKRNPEPPHQKFSVALGDTIGQDTPGKGAGTIEESGAVDTYTFSAKTDQRIYIQRLDCDNSYSVQLQLLRPGGKPVPNFDGYVYSCFSGSNAVTLPETGQYTLRIGGGPVGGSPGTYGFKLWASPIERHTTPMQSPIEGDIEAPRSQDSYAFHVDEGEEIRFDVEPESGLGLRWSLRGPKETVVDDGVLFGPTIGPFTFDTKGEYTLTISGDGDDAGSYVLSPHRKPSG
ncbi:PPC domain-containing protein [Streptomyces himalayensis]|uniref:Uncharacterized protein n=1 Tax=Streptomyces himalayensis subsp. himalayensis TaxID=2756131 RepID=A0A7W0DH46_9ACTN|nr:PPC domain-containing protein [Streptomyces himalayensis]MBA2944918.1 hypothetical protein [Streptomyces himalayensis subsp. himalayensis]